jgi:hypothetical protein
MNSKTKALGKLKRGEIPKHIHEAREKKFMERYNEDRSRNFKSLSMKELNKKYK